MKNHTDVLIFHRVPSQRTLRQGGYSMAAGKRKNGIDVSDNNGIINWKAAKADGVEFAILRATRGSGKTDYQFYNNAAGCRDNGIPFDVYKYVYATSRKAAKEEMQKVCELLKKNHISCTIWYDIEDKKIRALGKAAITRLVKAAEAAAAAYGFPLGIYTNKDWYENVIDASAFRNPFWIARYPSSARVTFANAPTAGKVPMKISQTLFGWQWSSKGNVRGIRGYVDMDVIYSR